MFTPPNPLPPPPPQLPAEVAPATPALASVNASAENPPWTVWDIVLLVIIFLVATNILAAAAAVLIGATHLFGYDLAQLTHDRHGIEKLLEDPRVILPVQVVCYLILLAAMIAVVRSRARVQQGFFENVGWRWPRGAWPKFLLAGAVLAIAVQLISARLPIPPSLPIEKYFQTTTYAYLMSAFGILVAPFMEELFFRGFLYPVLARSLGIAAAVVLTGSFFMLMHGAQLGFSWAAMLMLLIVGVVLTLVRVRTRALAPSVLVHMAYNTTIFVLVFVETGGFRHLERM